MKNFSLPAALISVLFVACLSTPMLVAVLSEKQTVSQVEKRKLAAFPEISISRSFFENFPKQFEKYVDDHFGFRSEIVKKHNYTLSNVFKVSPTDMVTIGSDNWYFFNGDTALHDYLGFIKFTDYQLEKTTRLLQDRTAWLTSLGIQYLFLPIPNKEAIYGEHLPYKLQANRGLSKYEQIVDYISENSTFKNFIDVQKLMLDHKHENLLYLKTDSHWNNDGAYLTYQEIISRLQDNFPDLTPLELITEKKWVETFSGDLAILMNLAGLVTEKAPALSLKQTCSTKKGERLKSIKNLPAYRDFPDSWLPTIEGCPKKKYKVLFIHDSFGEFLHPYFSEQFNSVIYVNYMNFETAKALIEFEKPDIVIDERVGRNLEKALMVDPVLEQFVLSNKFDTLPTTIAEKTYKETIKTQDKAFVIHLKSTFTQTSAVVLKCSITSQETTELSFCYAPENMAQNEQQQCEKRKLLVGNNDLFLRIIKPKGTGTIEIKSHLSGTWSLDSYVVKAEDF